MQAKLGGFVAVVVLAALAAGCGGSSRLSKAAYEQRIQKDGKAVQEAVATISGNPASLAQLAVQVAAAEKAARKAADDLGAAKPPSEIDADNAKIVAALRMIDTQLQKLEQAARNGDASAAQAAATAIQDAPEIKAAQAAAKDMQKKGYTIGVIGT
ncbi:MAG TPA: hypothetical protein VMU58_10850 [Gaiellaceae bacterium]|nr:hypothetical protein [Gaiellaceae bacterium]